MSRKTTKLPENRKEPTKEQKEEVITPSRDQKEHKKQQANDPIPLPQVLQNLAVDYLLSFSNPVWSAKAKSNASAGVLQWAKRHEKEFLPRRRQQLRSEISEHEDLYSYIQEQGIMANPEAMHKIRIFCQQKRHQQWKQITETKTLANAKNYCLYTLTHPNLKQINKNLFLMAKQRLEQAAKTTAKITQDKHTADALEIIELLGIQKPVHGYEGVQDRLRELLCRADRKGYINVSGLSFRNLHLWLEEKSHDNSDGSRKTVTIGANLNGAYANGTDFCNANFVYSSWIQTRIMTALFNSNTALLGAYFDTKHYKHTRMSYVTFDEVTLKKEPLHLAYLIGCRLHQALGCIEVSKEQKKTNSLYLPKSCWPFSQSSNPHLEVKITSNPSSSSTAKTASPKP